jgi:hypothetical protein
VATEEVESELPSLMAAEVESAALAVLVEPVALAGLAVAAEKVESELPSLMAVEVLLQRGC